MATPKVPLTITYRLAGTQPPMFVAGEFSDPPWEPQEMDFTIDEDGEHTFKKQVFAAAGSKVQYKFRVGIGEWWVLNEDFPTAMDAGGFLNNVAEVPSAEEPSDPAAGADIAKHTSSRSAGGADDQSGSSKVTGDAVPQAQVPSSVADAAKDLMPDLHSESGASTPGFAKTAAEVADSAALLDEEDEESDATKQAGRPAQELAFVANAAKELRNRPDLHSESGTSTPGFVRTAVEVADSAALLDKDDAESEISDGEAGRTGFRRMSATPIQDVAETAAEVADTAQALDSESIPRLEVRPADYDDMDPYGFDEPLVQENKAPLFAHECVGMELYEADDAPGPRDDEGDGADYEDVRRPSTVYDDDDDIDINDPTLEKFPSNRDEIIDTVRKLEGGLNEDHSDVEGLIPLSPVVGPSGPQNHDLVGDFLVSSPVVASPAVSRPSRLLSLPRSSLGSINSDRSSALSLGSISEAEEVVDEDEDASSGPPIISAPKPRRQSSKEAAKSPNSDDDEGVVMKAASLKSNKSREASSSEATPVPALGGDEPPTLPVAEAQHEDNRAVTPVSAKQEIKYVPASGDSREQTPEPSSQADGQSGTPRIVIQTAGEASETEGRTEGTDAQPPAPDSAKATGVDAGAQSQVKRRTAAPDRIGTPTSINETGIQAAKTGSWFRLFFRMLFVDWIGGFIRRLCGGKRET